MVSTKRTSEILQAVIDRSGSGSLSVGEFIATLGDRSFGLAILIFALPNSLPIPGIPGFSTITGVPIILLGLQMLLGRRSVWMPRKVSRVRFSGETMSKVLAKALPFVIWLEKYLRPRLHYVCSPYGERLLGLLLAVLAAIISLPIPLGNFLPGISITLLALGLLERDGLFISAAAVLSLTTIIFMSTVIVIFFQGVAAVFHTVFN